MPFYTEPPPGVFIVVVVVVIQVFCYSVFPVPAKLEVPSALWGYFHGNFYHLYGILSSRDSLYFSPYVSQTQPCHTNNFISSS